MSEHNQHFRNHETGYIECECCCKWALDAIEEKKRTVAAEPRARELEQALEKISNIPVKDHLGNYTFQLYARDIARAALHITDKAAK